MKTKVKFSFPISSLVFTNRKILLSEMNLTEMNQYDKNQNLKSELFTCTSNFYPAFCSHLPLVYRSQQTQATEVTTGVTANIQFWIFFFYFSTIILNQTQRIHGYIILPFTYLFKILVLPPALSPSKFLFVLVSTY